MPTKSSNGKLKPTLVPTKSNLNKANMSRLTPLIYMDLLLVGILSSFVANQVANAQTATDTPSIFGTRLGVGYATEGTGYDDFASFFGFIPLLQSSGNSLTFLEGQLLLSTPNRTLGGNVLLGHRFYSASNNRIFGGYISYDNRNTGNAVFNQLGAGFETLGEVWDFRANAYIPVGDTRHLVEESVFNVNSVLSDTFFAGNFLNFAGETSRQINRRVEVAMTGFDVEVGATIARLGETGDIRGYAGLYYYNALGSDEILGWRTRLEVRPTDTLSLGLSVQDDANFGSNVVLSVAANFPGNRSRGSTSKNRVLARMEESVARQANIVVDKQFESELSKESFTVLATNPKTNEPYFFQHVKLGTFGGDGTFERPFGTVQDALNVAKSENIVYLQPGKNPGISSFTLPNRVTLLSTGPVQRLDTIQRLGAVLPLSGAGVLPKVTGSVALAGNQTLSGLEIDTKNERGIVGINTSNLTIRDNVITTGNLGPAKIKNSLSEGIYLENVTGTVAIANNVVKYTGSNTVLSHIFFRNNQGQVDLTISNNTIVGNPISNSDAIEVNICRNIWGSDPFFSPCRESSQATVQILNNTLTNIGNPNAVPRETGDGIDINLGSYGKTDFTISGNTIQEVGDRGIGYGTSGTAQSTATISNNEISNYYRDAIGMYARDTAKVKMRIYNNKLSNNNFEDSTGFQSKTQQSGQLQVTMDSNNIENVGTNAVELISRDNSQTLANIQFNYVPTDGFKVEASNQAKICLQPRNNTSKLGFNLEQSDFSTLQVESTLLETNTGTINQTGTITNIPQAACGFP